MEAILRKVQSDWLVAPREYVQLLQHYIGSRSDEDGVVVGVSRAESECQLTISKTHKNGTLEVEEQLRLSYDCDSGQPRARTTVLELRMDQTIVGRATEKLSYERVEPYEGKQARLADFLPPKGYRFQKVSTQPVAERLKGLELGDWSLKGQQDGKAARKLSAILAGRPGLVLLWATWCTPCKLLMKDLAALAPAFEGRLHVLAVSIDQDAAAFRQFVSRHPYPFEFFLDPDFMRRLKISSVPILLFLDARGKVTNTMIGYEPERKPQLRSAIEQLVER